MLKHRLSSLVLSSAALLAGFGVVAATPGVAWAQGARNDDTNISMSIGETKTIPAAGVRNYSLATEGVADLRVSQESFVLTGKKPGDTSLLLIRNDGTQVTYSISVTARPASVVVIEVQKLLGQMPGVRVRQVGGKVFIEGGVSNEGQKTRIDGIAALYAGQVVNLTTVGQGVAESRLLVRLDFFFVYYERSSSMSIGIGWPASIGGSNNNQPVFTSNVDFDLISGTMTSARASVVNQALPRLDIGARNGWAKVAKQSTVITSNGSEARFSSGGEQNYLQTVGLTQSVIPIRFGTTVIVLPRYDSLTNDVEVKLEADVADLTAAASGTNLPGRTTTHLETLVTMKLGQALVLSGLKTESKRNDIEGLPLLSQIPILGALFGSNVRASSSVEAAVFIVPSVIDSVAKSSLDVIKNAMTTYDDFSGNMEGLDTFPVKPPAAK